MVPETTKQLASQSNCITVPGLQWLWTAAVLCSRVPSRTTLLRRALEISCLSQTPFHCLRIPVIQVGITYRLIVEELRLFSNNYARIGWPWDNDIHEGTFGDIWTRAPLCLWLAISDHGNTCHRTLDVVTGLCPANTLQMFTTHLHKRCIIMLCKKINRIR